jgi:hypothetical protein
MGEIERMDQGLADIGVDMAGKNSSQASTALTPRGCGEAKPIDDALDGTNLSRPPALDRYPKSRWWW